MSGVAIEGLVDLHCHFGPDFLRPGKTTRYAVTAIEAAREAAAAGYAAIVLKSHDFGSQSLAVAVEEAVGGLRVFGGLALDYAVGGLNAVAVEQTLLLGGKVVWLPTIASMHDLLAGIGKKHGYHGTGIPVVDDAGRVLPAVHEIFALVEQYDAILATGHIGASDHHAIAKEFGSSGRVLVTHAGEELAGPNLNSRQCLELAELGATIELSAQTCVAHVGVRGKTVAEIAETIRMVGAARCVLATDYGWNDALPRPVPGMQDFLDTLLAEGLTEQELRLMAAETPARLLGLAS